ncbi:hypothetical protein GZH53_10615 [Flavihumibacter sp. R14]|nr:hypothetical protein [Flavihumibacter soli]
MKQLKTNLWSFLLIFVLTCLVQACKQDNAAAPEPLSAQADGKISGITDPCATCVDQPLYKSTGNDNEVIGSVAICQTATQLTLTFTVSGARENAWFSQTGIRIDADGTGFITLNPGSLSREMNHGDKIRSYTWTIPFADIVKADLTPVTSGNTVCIAAYAVVPGPDGAGGMVWAGSVATQAGNPHPRSFCYEIKSCATPPCPTSTCYFSQGYWFAKPNGSQWPAATISFGGFDYTYAEARAIFFSSNAKGKTDAKQAFLQGLAMKLNLAGGSDPGACTGGTAALQSIETYFSTKPKQTSSTINSYGANSSLKSAASLLSNCIKANHCDNIPLPTY